MFLGHAATDNRMFARPEVCEPQQIIGCFLRSTCRSVTDNSMFAPAFSEDFVGASVRLFLGEYTHLEGRPCDFIIAPVIKVILSTDPLSRRLVARRKRAVFDFVSHGLLTERGRRMMSSRKGASK